ncbi:MAG: hypothetical protein IJZ68_07635 [Bacteroidaceae bacterium]|nr:hypothetical protein [Bacteroidaceae bacterium]
MEKILHWISHFKGAAYTLTNGCCYWFAYILQAQFGATIWYAPVQGHFVGEIDGIFYDANGVFTPCPQDEHKMLTWEAAQQMDPLWALHITRDCINFEERD